MRTCTWDADLPIALAPVHEYGSTKAKNEGIPWRAIGLKQLPCLCTTGIRTNPVYSETIAMLGLPHIPVCDYKYLPTSSTDLSTQSAPLRTTNWEQILTAKMSYGKDDSYSNNTRGSGYDDDSYDNGRGDTRRDATTRSNDGLASGGRSYDDDDNSYGGSGARGTRRNDGLETSTSGAYGSDTQGYSGATTRRNDGLSSGMDDDNYGGRSSGYGSTRANDGLATSGDDTYGGTTGRRRDDEYSSRTADQDLSTGSRTDRTGGGRYDDSSYGGELKLPTCDNDDRHD